MPNVNGIEGAAEDPEASRAFSHVQVHNSVDSASPPTAAA